MTAGMPTLFEIPMVGVNIASVPQRSPFRYAGGKTWFVPYLRKWLASLPQRPQLFAEPFAGGGSLACTVVTENLAEHVQLAELDEDVISVWQTVFSQDAATLAQRILDFELNEARIDALLQQIPQTATERAFQTIVRNRVNRGGILAPGAGRLKAGENGRGLLSRWYPETLARRIMDLAVYRERVTVIHGDALKVIPLLLHNPNTALFLDPPYTAGGKMAGSRLYRHSEVDHAGLFGYAAAHAGPALLTYDNANEVRLLAEKNRLNYQAIAMKTTHHAELSELVIGKDLKWLR